jgi:outer membrane murein-binding lipoprotein Lpp
MRSACLFRHGRPLLALGLIFGAISLTGCASDQDSIEKQLSKLHDDVTRLQAETDRTSERVDAMEVRASAARRDERVAAAESTTVSRPKLKIVRVEPDSEPTAAAASEAGEDSEAGGRVVIQGEGKTLESRTLPAPRQASKPAPANSNK